MRSSHRRKQKKMAEREGVVKRSVIQSYDILYLLNFLMMGKS